ncbi:MAG: pyrrolo-quinoline quinone [Planctomycetaceae bacterium]|nr:MAG: pyrrolo-quinoline quinone [Planctomycetaceae bacterium]
MKPHLLNRHRPGRCSAASRLTAGILAFAVACGTPDRSATHADQPWTQWRGAGAAGVALGEGFPTTWSAGEGIVWKLADPGVGSSTPILQGDRVLMTSGVDHQNRLLCIDATSGSQIWSARLGTDRGGKHRKASGANSSAVTDGTLTFAYFRSGDLGCVDTDGNVRWQKNLQDSFGEDTLWWDLGTSPILTDNAVVVAVMQSGPSYLVAFDKQTGKLLWRTDRMLDAPEEAAHSYSTPVRVQIGDTRAIAVLGADHLTLHAESDGRELARVGGFNPTGQRFFRSIASPAVSGEMILCPYARGSTLTGIRLPDLLAGKGEAAVAWFRDDLGSDVPTPAALDGSFFVCTDKGEAVCLDAETGKTRWQVSLPRSRHAYSSSPLVAGAHLYLTREDATTFVVGPISSAQPQLVATNQVDDDSLNTVASLVPVGADLLLRSRQFLYRITRP